MTKNLSTEARGALLLLFLVSFFNYMDRYVLSVLLPSIRGRSKMVVNRARLVSFLLGWESDFHTIAP